MRDTSVIYLLSARYHGIEYFSSPLDRAADRDPAPVTLIVRDTSSRVSVTLSTRHVVVPRPGDDGTRDVLDLVLLVNQGTETRVAPDSLSASWAGLLPPKSEGLEVGESDVSPDAVDPPGRLGDRVGAHFTGREAARLPVSPARRTADHRAPGGRRAGGAQCAARGAERERLGTGTRRRRQPGHRGPFVPPLDRGRAGERRHPHQPPWRERILRAGDRRPGRVLALALLLAGWRILPRRAVAAAPPGRRDDADLLLNEVAALDARYQGREAELPPEEWARYVAQRAALKAEAAAALARESRGP